MANKTKTYVHPQKDIDIVNKVVDKINRTKKFSGLDMCKIAVNLNGMRFSDGTKPTPQDWWNRSPTGELMHVYIQFADDVKFLKTKRAQKLGFHKIEINYKVE